MLKQNNQVYFTNFYISKFVKNSKIVTPQINKIDITITSEIPFRYSYKQLYIYSTVLFGKSIQLYLSNKIKNHFALKQTLSSMSIKVLHPNHIFSTIEKILLLVGPNQETDTLQVTKGGSNRSHTISLRNCLNFFETENIISSNKNLLLSRFHVYLNITFSTPDSIKKKFLLTFNQFYLNVE